MHSMEGLPVTTFGWLQSLSILIVGIFALMSLVDKGVSSKRKLAQEVDDGLISSLKESVEYLQRKQEQTTKELNIAKTQITTLQAENQMLKDIAMGRDGETKKFQTDAYTAMRVLGENMGISKLNHEAIYRIEKNIAELLLSINTLITKLPVQDLKGGV